MHIERQKSAVYLVSCYSMIEGIFQLEGLHINVTDNTSVFDLAGEIRQAFPRNVFLHLNPENQGSDLDWLSNTLREYNISTKILL